MVSYVILRALGVRVKVVLQGGNMYFYSYLRRIFVDSGEEG